MGYNARNDEIRDNVTRMRRAWAAERQALATVRRFNAAKWLACIEPYEPNHDKRTFECPVCPNVTVRIVRYRSEAIPRHIGVKYA